MNNFYETTDWVSFKDWLDNTNPVNVYLPFRFASGAILEDWECYCSECDSKISNEFVRGYIESHDNILSIKSFGYCDNCVLMTPFDYDIWDDLSIVGKQDNTWFRWKSQRE